MLYEAESGDITMAITGESLITRAMSVFREKRFLTMREQLHDADVRFTNAEMLFHNYEDPPTHRPGGTYMRCDPKHIEDLKWLGINMVGCANNHSYDFGENGILTNISHLDEYDMPTRAPAGTLPRRPRRCTWTLPRAAWRSFPRPRPRRRVGALARRAAT